MKDSTPLSDLKRSGNSSELEPKHAPSTKSKTRTPRKQASTAGSMRWRGRVEEAAPGVVLFALAATVIMITAGIVFVLFESGSKFYRGFGCGVDAYKPPQDWHEDVKAGIKEAAVYDDGKLSDPLWLDAFCIVDWDMEHEVVLAEPFIDRFEWDGDAQIYTGESGRVGSTFSQSDGTSITGPALDEDRTYLEEYFEANPTMWDEAYPKVPLGLIVENEGALILHKQNPELAREWWVTLWVWSDTAQEDVDQDGVANDAIDGAGTVLDNDIDGDNIANYLDEDIDGDGLPNPYDPDIYNPNVDRVGLFLGFLTLFFVLATFTCPRWLQNIPVEQIDRWTPALRLNALALTAIGFMSLLAPPQASVLFLLCVVCLILVFFGWRLDGRVPLSLACLAALSTFLIIIEFYAVQTGHTIALALSLVALTTVVSDSRNQAGTTRFATIDGDTRAILTVVVILTLAFMYFDVVARVNGSLGEFFTQTWWKTDVRSAGETVTVTSDLHMGVNSLLQTTLQVALGALVVAIPIGLGTAVFLSEYASPRTANIVKPILELLAGIPSVVYGFFAFVVIAPMVVDLGTMFLERGWISEEPQLFNPLNGAIVVGVMITPLIASLSEDALRAVPDSLRQASYALGATTTETTARVTMPSALSGILASIILALSRAIGETMAVTLSVGTLATFSDNMFRSAQTMTAYIAQRIGGELPIGTTPYYSLFAVGLYLFAITLGLNMVGHKIMTRFREAYD
jgi:phosphate transport system permease protein